MKDIVNKINEGKYCPFFSEIQNEKSKNGEYHTYDYKDGVKKYEKGNKIHSNPLIKKHKSLTLVLNTKVLIS